MNGKFISFYFFTVITNGANFFGKMFFNWEFYFYSAEFAGTDFHSNTLRFIRLYRHDFDSIWINGLSCFSI